VVQDLIGKGVAVIATNIEREYYDYVCSVWMKISDVVKDNLELHHPEHAYNLISEGITKFLQDKMENIEA